jgi:hypothetical protein
VAFLLKEENSRPIPNLKALDIPKDAPGKLILNDGRVILQPPLFL